MKLVIIESPYAGDHFTNTVYARECLKDSLTRGEAPLASHLLYTQVLDDGDAAQRAQGIAAGLEWAYGAHLAAFYVDRDMSAGMLAALTFYKSNAIPVVMRRLGGRWADA